MGAVATRQSLQTHCAGRVGNLRQCGGELGAGGSCPSRLRLHGGRPREGCRLVGCGQFSASYARIAADVGTADVLAFRLIRQLRPGHPGARHA